MHDILVLYYSHRGSVRALAERIARGIESVPGAQARLRTVPRVSAVCEATEASVPDAGAPYVEPSDLEECIGLALGSPVRFGNMAAPMKHFWDGTIAAWQGYPLISTGSVSYAPYGGTRIPRGPLAAVVPPQSPVSFALRPQGLETPKLLP